MRTGQVLVVFDAEALDGPTVRFILSGERAFAHLDALFTALAEEPACLSMRELDGFILDGVDDLRVESVPDEVPTRRSLSRIDRTALEWIGHCDDWTARAQLLHSIEGRENAFQFLDYETPGEVSVAVEYGPSE